MEEINSNMESGGFIRPEYFWDVDFSDNGSHLSRRLIVERVFCFGTMKEIRLLIELYGKIEILYELRNLNYIDPKTLNFIVKVFNLSKKSFKCYTRKQLTPQYWNS
jgi:hypothetical protein